MGMQILGFVPLDSSPAPHPRRSETVHHTGCCHRQCRDSFPPGLLSPILFVELYVHCDWWILISHCHFVDIPTAIRNAEHLVLGEGNGNPLQYSCLENSMDGGAW